MSVDIIVGDCRQTLKALPDESVQCCVTSPPYFGLRDYGTPGQIGLENSPGEFIMQLVDVFRDVRRVLANDGTLWLNLGDSYTPVNRGEKAKPRRATLNGIQRGNPHSDIATRKTVIQSIAAMGLKSKDLMGIPWRVALALQADGWYLRSDIVWHKPNPMPESVTDRPTKAHEYIFLLSKSERYFYDSEAIKEPAGGWNGSRFDDERDLAIRPTTGRKLRTSGKWSTQDPQSIGRRIIERVAEARANGADHESPFGETRNKRTVWTVPTQPYSEAHFATYPPQLIKPCILAGSRIGDTVLDPFGGSGTTGMVALELGRKAILCELNPEYAELARQRCNVTPGLAL